MKVILAVQARMAGTRQPGKVMMPIGFKPMLVHVMQRMQRFALFNFVDTGLCRTNATEDWLVQQWAEQFLFHRVAVGESLCLWPQFWDVSRGYDYCMRVCGDQPLWSLELAKHLLDEVIQNPGADYYGWVLPDGWPSTQTRLGITTEVFRRGAMAHRHQHNTDSMEHVTVEFYRQPEKYDVRMLRLPEDALFPCTVDTLDDARLVDTIVKDTKPHNPERVDYDLVKWWTDLQSESDLAGANLTIKKDYDGPIFQEAIPWEHISSRNSGKTITAVESSHES